MNQTLLLRLDPAAEQHGALRATMERFNEAANWVAGVAFARHTASKYLLQKEVYGELRFRFHLSAQEASPV